MSAANVAVVVACKALSVVGPVALQVEGPLNLLPHASSGMAAGTAQSCRPTALAVSNHVVDLPVGPYTLPTHRGGRGAAAEGDGPGELPQGAGAWLGQQSRMLHLLLSGACVVRASRACLCARVTYRIFECGHPETCTVILMRTLLMSRLTTKIAPPSLPLYLGPAGRRGGGREEEGADGKGATGRGRCQEKGRRAGGRRKGARQGQP